MSTTAVAALLGYVALWTLYGTIAKGSQDIHADMSEQFALGRELALGYPKHPPLAMAVVRAWFAVFPAADWAYYLLAMVNVGLALWMPVLALDRLYADGPAVLRDVSVYRTPLARLASDHLPLVGSVSWNTRESRRRERPQPARRRGKRSAK